MRCLTLLLMVLFSSVISSSTKYAVQIDIDEAYISGICIIKEDGSTATASIVNEFGVSLMTLKYDISTEKVKILETVKQLRNPMMKRTLKKDFKIILTEYTSCGNDTKPEHLKHVNARHGITYDLTFLKHETT